MKQPILVLYDYGAGGVWAFVLAESPEEVEREFPELKVVSPRPSWMTDGEEGRIAAEATYDLQADRSFGFLAEIIDSRETLGSESPPAPPTVAMPPAQSQGNSGAETQQAGTPRETSSPPVA
ncbi:MAG: hypothetical protein ACT4OS_04015 [Acidimicrobiales bacterium]